MTTVKLTRTEGRKLERVELALAALDEVGVAVGSQGEGGTPSPQHRDRRGRFGETCATILRRHEFGLGVPERSVFRAYLAGHAREISRRVADATRVVATGRVTPDQAAAAIGEATAEGLRERVLEGIPPPLAESTLADPKRNPSGIPLFDTGQLVASIRWSRTVDT